MPRYVAFLRAINLGKNRKFPRDAIIAASEAAGFTDVATYINTGNVRVETAMRSRTRVERALEEAFAADRGFEVPTIVFTPAELAAIVEDADALGAGHVGRQFVSLLKAEPSEEARRVIEAAGTDGERAVVRGRAAHLLLGPSYQGATITNDTVERHLGVATNRTLTVVRTVVSRWC